MTSTLRLARRSTWLSLAMLALGCTGCHVLNLPTAGIFSINKEDPRSRYIGLDPGFELDADESQEIYNKVRQAKAQQSVVLHVIDDDLPPRILPLPASETGKSVFVSDLLGQTGVQHKLGAVQVVLIRPVADSSGGLRMPVNMDKEKRSVLPESDYALQPGDRLRVEKAPPPSIRHLVEMALGVAD